MARQKRPRKVFDGSTPITFAKADKSVLESFFMKFSFNVAPARNKHRQLYNYIRRILFQSLTEEQKEEPIFAAYIERIARMSVIIDRIERNLFGDLPDMKQEEIMDSLGKNYISYLKELREFINALSNLKWVAGVTVEQDAVQKVKDIKREVEESAIKEGKIPDVSITE